MENRVIEIRQLVAVECWKHCPGEINPADLPSRGVELSELLCNPLWLNGPSCFHALDVQITGEGDVDEPLPEECLSEMKISNRLQFESVHNVFFSELHDKDSAIRCEDFSTLRRLLRVTGCVQKFIERVKAKLKDKTVDPELSASDITAAELYWIKVVQKSLMKNDKFSLWKWQFGMYLDESGVWRCRGRMENADLDVQAKCPIMLCSGHHFTTLVVLSCHQKVMHGGVKHTLTELQSRFWVVKGRSFVRKLIHQCMVCNKLSSKPYNVPPEPPLPSFRVSEVPPFTYVGVDYAGPLFLKGSETKVWISLFTCCVTRAIHLELVPDMTADSFIRCFKRFSARRGLPRKVISDNSKTFKSASRIISAILNSNRVTHYFAGIQVDWSFNLEKAPWWGGFFERMIRSMKGCLKRVIGHARLTFDELTTVVIEVEATLNSRPLSYMSPDDPDEPLTPSHLLTGHRLTSLPDLLTSNEDTDYTTPTSPADITR